MATDQGGIGERRLPPGAEVGAFRIVDLLHEGGMALLYAVEASGEDPPPFPLVMKIPRLAFGSHPGCLVGFEVELMILGRLAGPHVPRLVASGRVDGAPWLAMERIGGGSLTQAAARAPLDPAEVVRLTGTVAAAVHDLHRQNVIHHDLKPENVLFREDGSAVLVDFGLARHGELPDLVEEEFHLPAGTGAAISPEQLAGIRNDPRSDLFALGVLAYRLATGALPFGAPTTRGGMRRRLYVEPVPPRALRPGLPPWLQEIILRCLEIRPEARYATAAQLLHDLAHPGQVPLTARAARLRRAGPIAAAQRWLQALREPAPVAATPARHLAHAPHVMAAIDLADRREPLAEAMRAALRRSLIAEPDLRITLIAVLAPQPFGEESAPEIDHARQTSALVELRHWAHPLGLPADKLRVHLAESADPAATLLDYAAAHHVDRIVVGARGHSALRRYLGSVSARVVAEAPCSVSVVRPPENNP
ncbi:MAG: bifunctional serine/threonine-protein kinase/universal stress protein [Denitratisoma sp.]|nr:bifunctional serine/threonine-protein kinase/universal stress protein [Denitratisoma sp.]